MLYIAAETVREWTALELREVQPTWIGWAVVENRYVSLESAREEIRSPGEE